MTSGQLNTQPTIDIQDFSTIDPHDDHVHENHELLGGEQRNIDIAVATGISDPSPAVTPEQEKPRKLSRGASIKSLFGVGPKPPKTTPCGTPKPPHSPSATPRRFDASPNHNSPTKQFLQGELVHKHCCKIYPMKWNIFMDITWLSNLAFLFTLRICLSIPSNKLIPYFISYENSKIQEYLLNSMLIFKSEAYQYWYGLRLRIPELLLSTLCNIFEVFKYCRTSLPNLYNGCLFRYWKWQLESSNWEKFLGDQWSVITPFFSKYFSLFTDVIISAKHHKRLLLGFLLHGFFLFSLFFPWPEPPILWHFPWLVGLWGRNSIIVIM